VDWPLAHLKGLALFIIRDPFFPAEFCTQSYLSGLKRLAAFQMPQMPDTPEFSPDFNILVGGKILLPILFSEI
jgi:hypothetical protein